MSHSRVWLPALLTVGLTAASVPAAAQTLSADEKELASYTLTMPTVKKVMNIAKAMAEESAKDPKELELKRLKAEIEALESKDEITAADQAKIDKLYEQGNALAEEESAEASDNGPETIDEMAAMLKKHPAAMRALASEGLTAREYSRCMMALFQAAMIEGFSQGKADLTKLPAGVNPKNVIFMREHKAELEAMQRELAGSQKKN